MLILRHKAKAKLSTPRWEWALDSWSDGQHKPLWLIHNTMEGTSSHGQEQWQPYLAQQSLHLLTVLINLRICILPRFIVFLITVQKIHLPGPFSIQIYEIHPWSWTWKTAGSSAIITVKKIISLIPASSHLLPWGCDAPERREKPFFLWPTPPFKLQRKPQVWQCFSSQQSWLQKPWTVLM